MPAIVDIVYQDRFAPQHQLFEAQSYVVGRSASCDIQVDHPTVSRRHCLLHFQNEQWQVRDLNSTNGLSVNNQRCSSSALTAETVLQVGHLNLVFAPKSAHQLAISLNRKTWAKQVFASLQSAWQQTHTIDTLLPMLQESVAQLLNSDRTALVLLDARGQLSACRGYPQWQEPAGFTGTTTLIRQAVETQKPAIANNAILHQQLGAAASVQRANIKAAMAFPIVVNQVVSAVLYADSTEHHHYFTEQDIALIESFTKMWAMELSLATIDSQINFAEQQLSQLAG
ncbi:FHA domain-containing protein [Pseudidiomarina terrestris]|uniref:FHA domain-containing protein n=1 Tax=Pseudidiomarina terrestris TaxID=2820060 RepID=UPI00264E2D59|nr:MULTISPECIES: FHA domain-containing protein [unclassified Pseudidiomarina]MDN7135565.1 FHA domain-containing protein [Pseudidiomarina sp. 1ASP75-5]MDN7137397.1 FHA domain-containing protein [Pseudidiomarina sp. 1ASP75-14]